MKGKKEGVDMTDGKGVLRANNGRESEADGSIPLAPIFCLAKVRDRVSVPVAQHAEGVPYLYPGHCAMLTGRTIPTNLWAAVGGVTAYRYEYEYRQVLRH